MFFNGFPISVTFVWNVMLILLSTNKLFIHFVCFFFTFFSYQRLFVIFSNEIEDSKQTHLTNKKKCNLQNCCKYYLQKPKFFNDFRTPYSE